MTKWEYDEFALEYDADWSETLSRHGLDGWELVGMLHDEDPQASDKQARFVMKRPIAAEDERGTRLTDHARGDAKVASDAITSGRVRKRKAREEEGGDDE